MGCQEEKCNQCTNQQSCKEAKATIVMNTIIHKVTHPELTMEESLKFVFNDFVNFMAKKRNKEQSNDIF